MNKTYLITYDLRKPGRDYAALYRAIQSIASGCARPLESIWIVRSNYSAIQIRDQLNVHVDADDQVLVIRLANGDWGSLRVANDANDWLSKNLA